MRELPMPPHAPREGSSGPETLAFGFEHVLQPLLGKRILSASVRTATGTTSLAAAAGQHIMATAEQQLHTAMCYQFPHNSHYGIVHVHQ